MTEVLPVTQPVRLYRITEPPWQRLFSVKLPQKHTTSLKLQVCDADYLRKQL